MQYTIISFFHNKVRGAAGGAILNAELMLSKTDSNPNGRIKKSRERRTDRVDIFEFDTVYTLFELIDGIAWELSFHGTPKQCEIRR